MATSNVDAPSLPKLGGITPSRFSISEEVQKGVISDKFNLVVFSLCAVFVILQVLILIFYWKRLPPQIPLFYSKPWGHAMLATNFFVWILPMLGAFFVFLNFLIVIFLTRDNKFLSRALVVASLIVGFLTFYATLKVITLIA